MAEGTCPTAQSFVKDMIKHVQEGRIKEERINDAVTRILMAKKKHGIFEQALAPQEWLQSVGSDEHMKLAREAAQQGTVVLQNRGNALPLSKKEKICVAGEVADDLGMQLGGWSVKWQGFTGNDKTQGQTLWTAVQDRIPDAKFDKTGKCEGADTVIAVVGEAPYAEGYGDAKDGIHLRKVDQSMLELALAPHKSSQEGDMGRRVILVTMSGRPLWMQKQIRKADAFVASFVPGAMGGPGVLDVLLGEVRPTGKLSVTWPVDEKAPVNEHSSSSDVLFEMGHGLTYGLSHEL